MTLGGPTGPCLVSGMSVCAPSCPSVTAPGARICCLLRGAGSRRCSQSCSPDSTYVADHRAASSGAAGLVAGLHTALPLPCSLQEHGAKSGEGTPQILPTSTLHPSDLWAQYPPNLQGICHMTNTQVIRTKQKSALAESTLSIHPSFKVRIISALPTAY